MTKTIAVLLSLSILLASCGRDQKILDLQKREKEEASQSVKEHIDELEGKLRECQQKKCPDCPPEKPCEQCGACQTSDECLTATNECLDSKEVLGRNREAVKQNIELVIKAREAEERTKRMIIEEAEKKRKADFFINTLFYTTILVFLGYIGYVFWDSKNLTYEELEEAREKIEELKKSVQMSSYENIALNAEVTKITNLYKTQNDEITRLGRLRQQGDQRNQLKQGGGDQRNQGYDMSSQFRLVNYRVYNK